MASIKRATKALPLVDKSVPTIVSVQESPWEDSRPDDSVMRAAGAAIQVITGDLILPELDYSMGPYRIKSSDEVDDPEAKGTLAATLTKVGRAANDVVFSIQNNDDTRVITRRLTTLKGAVLEELGTLLGSRDTGQFRMSHLFGDQYLLLGGEFLERGEIGFSRRKGHRLLEKAFELTDETDLLGFRKVFIKRLPEDLRTETAAAWRKRCLFRKEWRAHLWKLVQYLDGWHIVAWRQPVHSAEGISPYDPENPEREWKIRIVRGYELSAGLLNTKTIKECWLGDNDGDAGAHILLPRYTEGLEPLRYSVDTTILPEDEEDKLSLSHPFELIPDTIQSTLAMKTKDLIGPEVNFGTDLARLLKWYGCKDAPKRAAVAMAPLYEGTFDARKGKDELLIQAVNHALSVGRGLEEIDPSLLEGLSPTLGPLCQKLAKVMGTGGFFDRRLLRRDLAWQGVIRKSRDPEAVEALVRAVWNSPDPAEVIQSAVAGDTRLIREPKDGEEPPLEANPPHWPCVTEVTQLFAATPPVDKTGVTLAEVIASLQKKGLPLVWHDKKKRLKSGEEVLSKTLAVVVYGEYFRKLALPEQLRTLKDKPEDDTPWVLDPESDRLVPGKWVDIPTPTVRATHERYRTDAPYQGWGVTFGGQVRFFRPCLRSIVRGFERDADWRLALWNLAACGFTVEGFWSAWERVVLEAWEEETEHGERPARGTSLMLRIDTAVRNLVKSLPTVEGPHAGRVMAEELGLDLLTVTDLDIKTAADIAYFLEASFLGYNPMATSKSDPGTFATWQGTHGCVSWTRHLFPLASAGCWKRLLREGRAVGYALKAISEFAGQLRVYAGTPPKEFLERGVEFYTAFVDMEGLMLVEKGVRTSPDQMLMLEAGQERAFFEREFSEDYDPGDPRLEEMKLRHPDGKVSRLLTPAASGYREQYRITWKEKLDGWDTIKLVSQDAVKGMCRPEETGLRLGARLPNGKVQEIHLVQLAQSIKDKNAWTGVLRACMSNLEPFPEYRDEVGNWQLPEDMTREQVEELRTRVISRHIEYGLDSSGRLPLYISTGEWGVDVWEPLYDSEGNHIDAICGWQLCFRTIHDDRMLDKPGLQKVLQYGMAQLAGLPSIVAPAAKRRANQLISLLKSLETELTHRAEIEEKRQANRRGRYSGNADSDGDGFIAFDDEGGEYIPMPGDQL